MLSLGLNSADKKLFEEALRVSHQVRTTLCVMNLDHTNTVWLTDKLIDGVVTVDDAAYITTRKLNATLLDTEKELEFVGKNPADGALFMDKMIAATYGVFVLSMMRWVDVPIFTGPVTEVEKEGDLYRLSCSGKEILAGEIWKTFKIPKNTPYSTAIRTIMVTHAGENPDKVDISTTTNKTAKETSYAFSDDTTDGANTLWSVAKKIATSISYDMTYNGEGKLIVKKPIKTSVFTFNDKVGGVVKSTPTFTYDTELFANTVKIIGKKPKKGSAPTYTAYPETTHPMHPDRLGRNGVPRYIPVVETYENLKTKAQCTSKAKARLEEKLLLSVVVKFDSVPIPHLEPGDTVTLKTEDTIIDFELTSFTIPLKADGTMTINYKKFMDIKKGSIPKRNIKTGK